MEIAPFQYEHLVAVTRLEGLIYMGYDPWSVNAFEQELKNPHSLWLVGMEGGGVMAYTGGWVVVGEFHLLNLAVALAHRRQGVGRQLMAALLAEAFKRGCGSTILEVREGNVPARGLYEKLGFKAERVRRGYYSNGEDAIVYALKPLTG